MVEVPADVSCRGFRGALKSPPKTRRPSWNEESFCSVDLKKETCPMLGMYILARVIHFPSSVPFTKRYCASSSMQVSLIWNGHCFANRIETPLVFAEWLVACMKVGNRGLESFGVESVLKWVSWRKTMSALFLCKESSNWERLSGRLRPRTFREISLIVLFWVRDICGIVWGWFRSQITKKQI